MEKLNFNNLLSWEDIYALGNPFGEMMHLFNEPVLVETACENKFKGKQFHDAYLKYVISEFDKIYKSDIMPNTQFDFALMFEQDEEGKWRATFSKVAFFASLLEVHTPSEDKGIYFHIAEELLEYKDKFKLEILNRLKERKLDYINRLRAIEDGTSIYNKIGYIKIDEMTQAYRSGRAQASWFIKHFDEVWEFLDRDYPVEVLQYLNKDKFMSLLCSTYIIGYEDEVTDKYYDSNVRKEKLTAEELIRLEKLLNYLNNYLLVAKYISEENGSDYNEGTSMDVPDYGLLKPDTEYIRNFYNDMIKSFENKDFIEFSSYEELLSARASETWNRITNKRLVKNIKVNFEMIRSGNKDVYNMDRRAPRVTSSKEKKAAKLKRDYELLEEKFAYYDSKEPVVTLTGIANFVGYFAQFYNNGCVVLDKFYRIHEDKRGKEIIVPASGEAIYIMNHKEFADLCQCTKPELIEEKNNNNPNVNRKNHSKNWQKNLDEIIDGKGYGGLDLDFLRQLTEELTGETPIQKKIQ